jgi:hypothetical protein
VLVAVVLGVVTLRVVAAVGDDSDAARIAAAAG